MQPGPVQHLLLIHDLERRGHHRLNPQRMQVRLEIFSGVPDPQWQLDEQSCQQLRQRLESLITHPATHQANAADVLGYSGMTIISEPADWPLETVRVSGGRVLFEDSDREARDLALEMWLLRTAPNLGEDLLAEVESGIRQLLLANRLV